MSGTISRFDLHQATLARLEVLETAVPKIHVYVGRPANVPHNTDRTGVAKYVVLFPSAGTPTVGGEDLAGSARDLDWGIHLLVVGAGVNDVLYAVDMVHDHLHRWRPTGLPASVNTDGFVPPLGYDPGPVRVNEQVKPVRYSLPLQYRLTATT